MVSASTLFFGNTDNSFLSIFNTLPIKLLLICFLLLNGVDYLDLFVKEIKMSNSELEIQDIKSSIRVITVRIMQIKRTIQKANYLSEELQVRLSEQLERYYSLLSLKKQRFIALQRRLT